MPDRLLHTDGTIRNKSKQLKLAAQSGAGGAGRDVLSPRVLLSAADLHESALCRLVLALLF